MELDQLLLLNLLCDMMKSPRELLRKLCFHMFNLLENPDDYKQQSSICLHNSMLQTIKTELEQLYVLATLQI